MIWLKSFSRPSRVLRVACHAAWIGSMLLLAACAPLRLRPADAALDQAQLAREHALKVQADWSLRGRIALSAAGRGGSGRIEWSQRGEDFEIRLTAPVTGQSWLMRRTAGQVVLEGLDGGPRVGTDAERLLAEATGWQIPVDAMAYWVRGARGPGMAELSYGPEGRPATLHQDGWVVEYRGWSDSSPPLPGKLYAKQEQASVRLVIDAWGKP